MNSYNARYWTTPSSGKTQMDNLDDLLKHLLSEERKAIDTRFDPTKKDDTPVLDKPLVSNYDLIGTAGFNPLSNPDLDSLMVWRKNDKGVDELVHLQDWMFDLRTNIMKTNQGARDWSRMKPMLVNGREVYRKNGENNMVEEVKRLMENGQLVIFPSQKDVPVRVVHYDRNSHMIRTMHTAGEIHREADKKPWFMGMGFLTNFITFVSSSAMDKRLHYESMQRMKARYQGQAINQAIGKVQEARKIDQEIAARANETGKITPDMHASPRIKRMLEQQKKRADFAKMRADYYEKNKIAGRDQVRAELKINNQKVFLPEQSDLISKVEQGEAKKEISVEQAPEILENIRANKLKAAATEAEKNAVNVQMDQLKNKLENPVQEKVIEDKKLDSKVVAPQEVKPEPEKASQLITFKRLVLPNDSGIVPREFKISPEAAARFREMLKARVSKEAAAVDVNKPEPKQEPIKEEPQPIKEEPQLITFKRLVLPNDSGIVPREFKTSPEAAARFREMLKARVSKQVAVVDVNNPEPKQEPVKEEPQPIKDEQQVIKDEQQPVKEETEEQYYIRQAREQWKDALEFTTTDQEKEAVNQTYKEVFKVLGVDIAKEIAEKEVVQQKAQQEPAKEETEADYYIRQAREHWEEDLKSATTDQEKEQINQDYTEVLKNLGVDVAKEKAEKEIVQKEEMQKEPDSLCIDKMRETIQISQLQDAKLDSFFSPKWKPEVAEKRAKIVNAMSEADMTALNICCALSSPFTLGTQVSMQFTDKQSLKENTLYVTHSIFNGVLGDGGNRQSNPSQEIANLAIEDAKNTRRNAVHLMGSGDVETIGNHIRNGLTAMTKMLQVASPDDFAPGKDTVMMLAKGIKKTMDFLDRNPQVAQAVPLSKIDANVCRGWSQFVEIHENSIQAQEAIVSGKPFDPKAAQLAIAQEHNIRTICANSAKKREQSPAKDDWELTKAMSSALPRTREFAFIEAMGGNPQHANIAKVAPEWDPTGLSREQIAQYMVETLPEQALKLPIHQDKTLLENKPISFVRASVQQPTMVIEQPKLEPVKAKSIGM